MTDNNNNNNNTATDTASSTTTTPPTDAPWPLYDLFLDVPHPAASQACPPPFLIPSPIVDNTLMQELHKSVPQISRFCFPEYLPETTTAQQQQQSQQQQQQHQLLLNQYDTYALQNIPFQQFTFTLQLGTGVRMHGHVRRYLPPHLIARGRYDVGRRGERALVILTRASGADLLYAAVLKSIEAISSQQAALPPKHQAHAEPQKWFLHQLMHHQQQLAKIYQSAPPTERGKPLLANIQGLELGQDCASSLLAVDTSRFILPTCLLHKVALSDPSAAAQSRSILPLLRCVGVTHALRIMSALLSERRVILISSSPTRLAACSHAAISMLAQGLLHWQHLYIPVLPPHLWQYLAAPYPYLIGILAAVAPRLDRTDGLGEVFCIHLDTNQLETRGMDAVDIPRRLPDLFQAVENTIVADNMNAPFPTRAAAATPTENLGQELVDLLKNDRKVLYGESAMDRMGETAAKATKAVKSTFIKLRNKGRQYLQKRSDSAGVDEADEQQQQQQPDAKSLAPDYIYTEACHNEAGEEEARIAFTTFFLCMFGNMRWYLSAQPGQQLPTLDRERFLQQKRSMGEGEGTSIWPLLQNFVQTQMLAEFVKARIEETRLRQPVTPDAPLFLQCASYHRQHNIDFGLLNVRRVTRQVAQSSPGRLTGMLQTNARRMAMTLTSNKMYEGDYGKAIAQLVDQCRESSSILFDVMSVIWLRLRDSRGMQWKHGYQALQILRNLLYHGPLAVIAEATDGLEKIRAMKYYENMRSQIVPQVRTAASTVYSLLVDRAKLYAIRRVCAYRRLQLQNPPKLYRDRNLRFDVPFRNIHAAMHPNARGTVVSLPPVQSPAGATQQQPTPQAVSLDIFGSPPPQQPTTPMTSTAQDMMGLFDNLVVSESASGGSNPFDQIVQPSAVSSEANSEASTPVLPGSGPPSGRNSPAVIAQPTIVQMPPPPPQQQQQFQPTIVQIPPQPPALMQAPAPPQQQQQQQQQYPPPGQTGYGTASRGYVQHPTAQQYAAPTQQGSYPPPQQQQQQQYPGTPQTFYQQPQQQQQQYPPQYAYPPQQQQQQHYQPGQAPPPQQQQQQRNIKQFDPFA